MIFQKLDLLHSINTIKTLQIVLLCLIMAVVTSSFYKYISLVLLILTCDLYCNQRISQTQKFAQWSKIGLLDPIWRSILNPSLQIPLHIIRWNWEHDPFNRHFGLLQIFHANIPNVITHVKASAEKFVPLQHKSVSKENSKYVTFLLLHI